VSHAGVALHGAAPAPFGGGVTDGSAKAYLEFQVDGVPQQLALSTVCRIGRSENNTLVLNDNMVSRQHAMLQFSDAGQYYITDLGSSNGTMVNGTRIAVPVILTPGDQITIGSYELVFRQESEPLRFVVEESESNSTSIMVQQKLITVLVVDIRDFTVLAQKTDATVLAQITGTLFREGGQLLHARGAWAQKYIGDAIMAVWVHPGWGDPKPEEFIRILDGLCRLVNVTSKLQDQFHLDEPVRIGAGINTGLASVGNIGSIAASDYTALGDVVNKAFRLESATRGAGCDVLVGKDAHAWLGRIADLAPLFEPCTVTLKGYAEPVTAYRVQSAKLAEALAGRETKAAG